MSQVVLPRNPGDPIQYSGILEGLTFCAVPTDGGTMVDLVSGIVATNNGGVVVNGDCGLGYKVPTNGMSYGADFGNRRLNSVVSPTNGLTLLAIAATPDAAGARQSFLTIGTEEFAAGYEQINFLAHAGSGIYSVNGVQYQEFPVSAPGSSPNGDFGPVVTGKTRVFVASHDLRIGGTNLYCIVDGAQVASYAMIDTVAPFDYSSRQSIVVGGALAGARAHLGPIYLVAVWDRALPVKVLCDLSANPLHAIRTIAGTYERRVLFFGSAAARRRNRLALAMM